MGLLDVLQSASNAVAGNVAGPVDILSLLLRKGGIPIPDEPVGGSEWMKRKGLMRDVPMGAERIAGETIGLLAPTAIAAKAPQIARGLLQAQENAAAPRALSPEAGVIVYHGSPHKFDKFDASKIGTGEGAQAYGHGVYVAESPRVAENYAKVLPSRVDTPEFWAGKLLPKALNAKEFAEFGELGRKMQKSGNLPAQEMARWRELNEIRSAFDAAIEAQRPSSNLYKADLPDEFLPKMLDWDKPLSQQANVMDLIGKNEAARTIKVLNAKKATLQNLGNDHPNAGTLKKQIILLEEEVASPSASGLGTLTGGDYYNYLRRRDVDPKSQAEMFRSAGIPGIRYLDGGSRSAGQGTYNYVVFPGLEDQIKILERNGVPLGLLGR